MGRFLIELHLKELEYDALSALIPGFGDSVEEVVKFIIANWLMENLGLDWMQSQRLVKRNLTIAITARRKAK